jgi:predicted transcriptional regulator of viral defense system
MSRYDKAIEKFKIHGGQLRMKQAIDNGISRRMLYTMRDAGVIEQVTRGIYRLSDMAPISNPDLVTVALRFPKSVVCLISALSLHEITTQIPRAVSIAVSRKSRLPYLEYPKIDAHRFSGDAFSKGVEKHLVEGIPVLVYSVEKTLADCFKFRNQIGMDVVLEALKFYRSRKKLKVDELMHFAKICRVASVMRPYLEASL